MAGGGALISVAVAMQQARIMPRLGTGHLGMPFPSGFLAAAPNATKCPARN